MSGYKSTAMSRSSITTWTFQELKNTKLIIVIEPGALTLEILLLTYESKNV